MNLSRRGLLLGGGALVVAPAIVKVTSLMPLRGVKLSPIDTLYDTARPLPHDSWLRKALTARPLPHDSWLRKALTHYILDEQNNVVALPTAYDNFPEAPAAMHPVNLAALMRWGEFMQGTRRVVSKTKVGDAQVSTVFLGIDHSYGDGPPVLFESLVFGGKLADKMDRYETWKDAERGHAELVKRVRAANGVLRLVTRNEEKDS